MTLYYHTSIAGAYILLLLPLKYTVQFVTLFSIHVTDSLLPLDMESCFEITRLSELLLCDTNLRPGSHSMFYVDDLWYFQMTL